MAAELTVLHAGRARLLALAAVSIVRGHGPAFTPDEPTPR
jgi:hypothetical protein